MILNRSVKSAVNSLKNNNGFALINLIAVMVIIALLFGAIMSGRDLIRAATVRAVISQVHNYESAINAFKLKYHALPGDFDNASSFWPVDCVDDGVNTCNGNQDGQIYPSTSEGLRAWQHLGLADMISGKYAGVLDKRDLSEFETGFKIQELFISTAYAKQPKVDICHNDHTITVAEPAVINAHLAHGDKIGSCTGVGGEGGTGSADELDNGKFTIGYNIPASKMKRAGYKLDWNYGNLITFAIERSPYMDGAAISPQEAWNIDYKVDDGVDSDGHVLGANGYSYSSCILDPSGYDITNSDSVCQMHFWFE